MKSTFKVSYLLFSLILLLLVISPVQAKDIGQTDLKRPNSLTGDTNREEVRLKRQERRATIAKQHADRLSKRFTFYYERLSAVMDKVKARLEAMLEEDKDVTDAMAKLEEARSALEEAKSLADLAIAGFSDINPEDINLQADEIRSAKELITQAQGKFKEAVILMKESIKLAKEASEEAPE